MKIRSLDHLVLTVTNISETIRFYTEVLGMKEVSFAPGQKALSFGQQKINLHQQGKALEPKAMHAACGTADLCFITSTPIEEVLKELAIYEVTVLEGIVARTGAVGPIRSIYLRDPDQNLIKISNYEKPDIEIDKLAYVRVADGMILSTRSKGKDKYYIPGGKREAGENDVEALSREILEELSVDLLPATFRYIGTFRAQAHGHVAGVQVKMTCYDAAYTGELQAASEIEEIRWLTYQDMDLISHVDKVIFQYLRDQGVL